MSNPSHLIGCPLRYRPKGSCICGDKPVRMISSLRKLGLFYLIFGMGFCAGVFFAGFSLGVFRGPM